MAVSVLNSDRTNRARSIARRTDVQDIVPEFRGSSLSARSFSAPQRPIEFAALISMLLEVEINIIDLSSFRNLLWE
jgi:hypothetical protein